MLIVAAVAALHCKTIVREVSAEVWQRGVGCDDTERLARLIAHIPTAERDSLWGHNAFHKQEAWRRCGIMQRNRMFILKQMCLSPELLRAEGNAIVRERPKWVVSYDYKEMMMINGKMTNWKNSDGIYPGSWRDAAFLRHGYRLAAATRCHDGTDMYLLRRK